MHEIHNNLDLNKLCLGNVIALQPGSVRFEGSYFPLHYLWPSALVHGKFKVSVFPGPYKVLAFEGKGNGSALWAKTSLSCLVLPAPLCATVPPPAPQKI